MAQTTFAPGSLEADCPGGLDWAFYGLGECIRTTRDKVSIAFGVMSIASWFMFGFPQIYTNCVKKIPDTAVSIWLLIFWLLGDSLNFIGAFLTDQLFMQKLLAGYTVVIDILLMGQYIYYLFKHKRSLKKQGLEEGDFEDDMSTDHKSSRSTGNKSKILGTVLLGVVALSVLPFPGAELQSSASGSSAVSGRALLQAASTTTTEDPFANFLPTIGEKVGYAFGWASAIMYAFGRMHQIFVNWRRKCTEGLSFYLFFLAVLGNTFYGCQIFIKSINAAFVVTSLPWILGSMGILLFDFFILCQFCWYKGRQTDALAEDDFEISELDETPRETL